MNIQAKPYNRKSKMAFHSVDAHERIVARLIETGQYFSELQLPNMHSRPVGINEHGFLVDDGLVDNRMNIWYFSHEFEKIAEQQIGLNIYIVSDLFHKHKDKLTDLAWIVVNYE